MALASEEAQTPDGDPNHRRASQKSKAEQLARIRRNQQRCRQRKRTHVAELERQVEALQTKIQQCEPCAPRSLPAPESALNLAQRENAARRELLLALGFDDESQQRFIESAAKRQTVYTILQGEQNGFSSTPLTSNSGAPELTSPIESWDMPSDNLDLAPPMMDPSDDSWLTESYNIFANFTQDTVNSNGQNGASAAAGAISNASQADNGTGSQLPQTTSTNDQSGSCQSIDRCFLDTVVQLQPVETQTVCSKALGLVFGHNRKGLSMAQIQQLLKPGIKAPTGSSGECCVENSVLYRVLADIST